MKGIIKKSLLLGLEAASLTKKTAEKLVKGLVGKGVISKNDGDGLIREILAEANRERKRVEKFIKGEIKRELKKAKPLVRKAGKRAIKKGKKIAKKGAAKGKRIAKKVARKAVRRR